MTMSDVPRLLELFSTGRLVRPSVDRLNFVNLARSIARSAGDGTAARDAGADRIADMIGEWRRLVFVLVDGLGTSMVEAMPPGSFLRRMMRAELQAVFPPSTAPALTSLATAAWPAQHAITSWWTHVPALGDTVTVLPFKTRDHALPLSQKGITPEQVFPVPSRLARYAADCLSVLPSHIVDSVASAYLSGATKRMGYERSSIGDAVRIVIDRHRNAAVPAYTYLYLPQIDTAAHEKGVNHPDTRAWLERVDRALERLALALDDRARIVVTADHGHLAAPPERRHWLDPGDPLCRFFRRPPAGDSRVLFLYVDPARRAEFEQQFRKAFGRRLLLLTRQEVEDLALMGPGMMSRASAERVGDYVVLSTGADVVEYVHTGHGTLATVVSFHSGLNREEMLVPLIVA